MTGTIRGIARWSRLALPLFALFAVAACESGVDSGIRVGIQNSTTTQYNVTIRTSSGTVEMVVNQGYRSTIVEGAVGDVVTVEFRNFDTNALEYTQQCTATASIVGPDGMQAEYGQVTIARFQPGNELFGECSSGWEEGRI